MKDRKSFKIPTMQRKRRRILFSERTFEEKDKDEDKDKE